MAESKVKEASKAGAKGSSNGSETPKAVDEATGVETVQQPAVEVLPDAHQGGNPSDEPVATSTAEPKFPKETYL
ncbi:MAG: hypothetical protein EOO37_00415, partial [Cytophagaceae bacterium]